MKLQDSPAVKVKVPSHNQLEDSANDARNQRGIGEVESGSSIRGFHSPVQPDADETVGAAPVRTREIESDVTAGHHVHGQGAEGPEPYKHEVIGLNKNLARHAADETHVHANTPEAQARKKYTDEQYAHRDFYAGTRKE